VAASKLDKDSYSLLSEYSRLYQERYGSKPVVNKYKEKWAMNSLIEDFGKEEVLETLVYYFKLSKDRHPINWFYNNFSTIYNSRISIEKDDKIRSEARKKTQQLRAEYLNVVY